MVLFVGLFWFVFLGFLFFGFFLLNCLIKRLRLLPFFQHKSLLNNDLETSGSPALVELFQPEATKLT